MKKRVICTNGTGVGSCGPVSGKVYDVEREIVASNLGNIVTHYVIAKIGVWAASRFTDVKEITLSPVSPGDIGAPTFIELPKPKEGLSESGCWRAMRPRQESYECACGRVRVGCRYHDPLLQESSCK